MQKNFKISNICSKKYIKGPDGKPTGEIKFLNVGILKEYDNGGKTIELNHVPSQVYQVFPREEDNDTN